MSDLAQAAEPAEIWEPHYVQYHSDKETTYLTAIRQLISKDLSEPYSIYVYRYFLYQWGDLCFMVSPFVTERPLISIDWYARRWTSPRISSASSSPNWRNIEGAITEATSPCLPCEKSIEAKV